jgi:decaprenyl-phosphate phosphoribosyltransferase
MPSLQATARSHARPVEQGALAERRRPPGRLADKRAPARDAPGRVLLEACRPRQWTKNALVALAPAAAGALTRPRVLGAVIAAFIAFCLLSSATYLVNDVRDREQDRRHPRKRRRPIASGQLAPRGALRIAALMAVLGIALSFNVQADLGVVAVSYLALTTSYSILWRRIVIADIVAVAGGFVLRAAAGGAATGVSLSRPFVIVISACALFVVAGKRYAEIDAGAGNVTRPTLGGYSRRWLRRVLALAAATGCAAYASWALAAPERLGPWLAVSPVPFVLWIARYRSMLGAGAGEAPEELILRDPALLALGALWVVLFVSGIYVAR